MYEESIEAENFEKVDPNKFQAWLICKDLRKIMGKKNPKGFWR
jgi:hypothetical protein